MAQGCGCKICKAGLGEAINDLVREGASLKSVQEFLKDNDLQVSVKLIKKHLAAFDLYVDAVKIEVVESEITPNTINLNEIDFSQYAFDLANIDSIIDFIQKVNLKIFLNQQQIVLQKQQDIIDGRDFENDGTEFRNLGIAYKLFEASTGLKKHVDVSESAKTLEAKGFKIESKTSINN